MESRPFEFPSRLGGFLPDPTPDVLAHAILVESHDPERAYLRTQPAFGFLAELQVLDECERGVGVDHRQTQHGNHPCASGSKPSGRIVSPV